MKKALNKKLRGRALGGRVQWGGGGCLGGICLSATERDEKGVSIWKLRCDYCEANPRQQGFTLDGL